MAEEEENRRRSMAAGAVAEEDDEEDKESETETDGEELEPDESEPDDAKAPEAAGAHGGSGANPNPSVVSSMMSLDRIAVNQGGEGNGKVGGEGAAAAEAEAASALSLSLGEGQVGKGSEREESTAAASRRLFQRLWTDEEEIRILRGFLEFTQRRGTTFASHQYDTGPFYEEIRQQLHLDFSKNQLIEKLRRLKKKYRNCAARMRTKGPAFSFRGPHEQAIYEIARHIWRPANKRQAQEELADFDLDHTVDPLTASSSAAPAPPSEELNFSFSFSPVPPPSSAVHLDEIVKPQSRSSGRRARRRIQQDTFPHPPPPPPILPTVVTAGITAAIPVSMSPPPIQHDAAVAAAAAAAAATAALPAIPVTPTVVPVPSPISHSATEETVRSCLSPLFKELVSSAIEGGASLSGLFGLGPMPTCPPGKSGDNKWRRQHILELEVYLQRIELVKEQVMQTIQELKGGSRLQT